MNHVIIRMIFSAAHSTAEYIEGEGAFCPVCDQILHKRCRGIVARTDGLVRYCRCNQCGINFKSVEKIEDRTIPEIVDAKPKKRQSKNRKG